MNERPGVPVNFHPLLSHFVLGKTGKFKDSYHYTPFPQNVEISGEEAHKIKDQLFCSTCKRETNQTLQYAQTSSITPDSEGMPYRLFWDMWLIWRCNGCDSLILQVASEPPEWFEGKRYYRDPVTIVYPKFEDGQLEARSFSHVPQKLGKAYNEIVLAFNADLHILCTIGLRSLVEEICDDKRLTKQGDYLRKKIEKLVTLGISVEVAESLLGVKEIGDKAAHELRAAKREQLRAAITVLEEILGFAYDLEAKARPLRRIAKRRPNSKEGENSKRSDVSK